MCLLSIIGFEHTLAMSTTAPTKLMTAADLLAMGPDFHGELVRGRLIGTASGGDVLPGFAVPVRRFFE